MTMQQEFTIGPDEAGCRADRIVRKRCALLPLSTVYLLFRKGKVRVNGKKSSGDYRLQEGDLLAIGVDKAEITVPKASDASLVQLTGTSFFKKNFIILFEDDHLIACDKPSGLVVHPGSGHQRRDTLIDCAMAYLLAASAPPVHNEAALVHRLDRDTSGVILIAKNKRTLRALHEAFVCRDIEKEYRALCHNRPPEYEGEVTVNLTRTNNRVAGMKMRVADVGQAARSRYVINRYENGRSEVTVYLETGKTHQIRVQMAHLGAPIIGDIRYGDRVLDDRLAIVPQRLYLHAHRLRFTHPHTHRTVTIKAPLPAEFAAMMQ